MLFLSKENIEQSFSMQDAIQACKDVLSMYSKGMAEVPLRTNSAINEYDGHSLYMPAYVSGEQGALGIKIASVYPGNVAKNLPSINAVVLSLDPKTGVVTAYLDGTYLTQLRTGAVQGAATDLLARKDASIGALIGTGGQAASQLEAMLAVRNLSEVRVCGLDFERTTAFVNKMRKRFDIELIAVKSSKACVSGADIITTVTTSTKPTFAAEWIKAGAHINGIGAYMPEMCEIPKEIIGRADVIIFDTMDGVLGEAGDFIVPLEQGFVSIEDYHGELGELVNGDIQGRSSDQQITIFKSVGSAVLDVVVAAKIVAQAQTKNLGVQL